MNIKEALKILESEFVLMRPKKCIEYDEYFIFYLSTDKTIEPPIVVDKQKRKVIPFTPTLINRESSNNHKTHKLE